MKAARGYHRGNGIADMAANRRFPLAGVAAIWHNNTMSHIRNTQKNSVTGKLMGRLRLSRVLSIPEKEFSAFIAEIEGDDLFGALARPARTSEKVVSYKRFPRGTWARQVQFNEGVFAERPSMGVHEFLAGREDILPLLRRVGEKSFLEDFLYRETSRGLEETAGALGLTLDEAGRIMDFVNEFHLKREIEGGGAPAALPDALKERGADTPVAQIYAEGGNITLSYLSLSSARGRYEIDYARLKALERTLPTERKKRLRGLIGKMELANMRKGVLHNILLQLIDCQHKYLITEEEDDIKPVSQREIARTLAINSGVLNRIVSGKSLALASGRAVPMGSLFLSRKDWMKAALGRLLAERGGESPADGELAALLRERTGVRVSRRSVNDYRREIAGKLPGKRVR